MKTRKTKGFDKQWFYVEEPDEKLPHGVYVDDPIRGECIAAFLHPCEAQIFTREKEIDQLKKEWAFLIKDNKANKEFGVDAIKAVLCNPDDKVCIQGSDEDRKIIAENLAHFAQMESLVLAISNDSAVMTFLGTHAEKICGDVEYMASFLRVSK